jgi:hypothetical protein
MQVTEPIALFPTARAVAQRGAGVEMDVATARLAAARRHLPALLCSGGASAHGSGMYGVASGCAACPAPARLPQTKFLVKRVSRALNDTTGVRAFIDALDPKAPAAGTFALERGLIWLKSARS